MVQKARELFLMPFWFYFLISASNKKVNNIKLENLNKKLIVELRACRGASKYFDGICNLELGLKPDWTLIKNSSLKYTGIFDNG